MESRAGVPAIALLLVVDRGWLDDGFDHADFVPEVLGHTVMHDGSAMLHANAITERYQGHLPRRRDDPESGTPCSNALSTIALTSVVLWIAFTFCRKGSGDRAPDH